MKWYQIAIDWKQFTGMVKAKWDKLTDGDLTTFGGNSDQLAASSRRSTAMRRTRRRDRSRTLYMNTNRNITRDGLGSVHEVRLPRPVPMPPNKRGDSP